MSENLATIRKLITRLINSGSSQQLLLFFKKYHEADIAEAIQELPAEIRQAFFLKASPELSSDVLEELTIDQQIEVLSTLKVKAAAKFIEEMHPDDAADLLEELLEANEDHAEQIISALPEKDQEDLKSLLSYAEDSAGSLMTSYFISIPENLTIEESIETIKKQDTPDSELSFYVFIVAANNQLKGYITLRDLILASPNQKVKELRNENLISVKYNTDQEEVALLFQKYNMAVLPVTDEQERLLGVITIDDIVDVFVDEASEDVYKLSGTVSESEESLLSGSILRPFFSRTPWLLITILGGLLASKIINEYSILFKDNLFSLTLSLSFVPLLMGLGGNVGNQSSAIIVRGLATGTVKLKNSFKLLFRELLVGLSIAIVIALFLFITTISFNDYLFVFSLIVSVALFANIVVASFIGTSLPLLLNKFNIDPAVASAPFISTALDIVGQLIYFSITLLVLKIIC
jgi:magnesium transporter